TNPYVIHESLFLPEISSSLHEASLNHFLAKDVFMKHGQSKLHKAVAQIKPIGCTPLLQKKNHIKAQLKGRISINQQLKERDGPDLRYDRIYRSWSLLKSKLVIDKTTIPLAEVAIYYLIALKAHVKKIALDFKYQKIQNISTEKISFMQEALLHNN
ncbi:34445_t:CDS:2, partial [Gigaspora margarita]